MTETTSSTPAKSPAGASSEISPPAWRCGSAPSGKAGPGDGGRQSGPRQPVDGARRPRRLGGSQRANPGPGAGATRQRAGAQPGVLLPQSEWEARYGRPETDRVRLAVMGMAASANTRAVRATRFVLRTGGVAVDAARWPLDHIFLFRPLRYGNDRVAEAANQQIDRWVEAGRALDSGEPRRRRGFVGARRPGFRGYRDRRTPRPGAHPGDRRRGRVQASPRRSSRRCASTRSSLDMRVDRAWATLRVRARTQSRDAGFRRGQSRTRSPIRRKWPAGPTSAARYAGIASRVLAFSIDIFALIIALIIAMVFVGAIVSIFNLDRLFQTLFGTSGFGTLRMVASGVVGTLIACVYWIFGWTFVGGTVGKYRHGVARGGAWRCSAWGSGAPCSG